MEPLRLYLAGPMRGHALYNFPAFEAGAAVLRDLGHDVVSPAEMDLALGFDPARPIDEQGFDYDEAMARDLDAILTVQGVALLPGSSTSSGARTEYEFARALGLRVFLLRDHGLYETTYAALDVSLDPDLRASSTA